MKVKFKSVIKSMRDAYEMHVCEIDDDSIERGTGNLVPADDIFYQSVTKGVMPKFNSKCSACGALCFDADKFCSECGIRFLKG